jgi:hypothetical protein
MKTRDEIEAILRTEIERALMSQEAAKIEYRKVLDELSRDNPSCEAVDRLEEARRAETAARDQLWRSLLRLNEFCRDGTVPADLMREDLKESGEQRPNNGGRVRVAGN